MTVKITDPDVLDKIAKIGGLKYDEDIVEYKRHQQHESDFTFAGAKEALRLRRAFIEQRRQIDPEEAKYLEAYKGHIATFFGPGTAHHYHLTIDGRLHFNCRHNGTKAELAEKLGFDLYGRVP